MTRDNNINNKNIIIIIIIIFSVMTVTVFNLVKGCKQYVKTWDKIVSQIFK